MYARSILVWVIPLFYSLTGVSAHMAMTNPSPIRHPNNPFTVEADPDYINPLSPSGSNFPCKGHHALLDSPEGESVAQWQAGQSYSMTISGGANHNGGSCQASLSHDGGRTFKVIQTYIGNCPSGSGETSYRFTIPRETPSADRAILAWTWFNNLGNREMYMNCAVVSISGGGRGLGARPNIFAANVGNGCSTPESQDVMFPNPGTDTSMQSTKSAPPTGSCETGPGAPGSGSTRPGETSPDQGTGHLPGESPADEQPPVDLQPDVGGQPPMPPWDFPGEGEAGTDRDSVADYVPGNDWPEWYSGADRFAPNLLHIVLLQLWMIGVHFTFRCWVIGVGRWNRPG